MRRIRFFRRMALAAAALSMVLGVGLCEGAEALQPDAATPAEASLVEASPGEATPGEASPVMEIIVDGYALTCANIGPQGITYAAQAGEPGLTFFITLGSGEEERLVPVFTLLAGSDNGDTAVVLTGEDGLIIPLAAALAQEPEGLTQEEHFAFLSAQLEAYTLLATAQMTAVPAWGSAQEDGCLFETDTFTVTCPPEAAQLVQAQEREDGSLVFFTRLAGQDTPVFTIGVGTDEGHVVQMIDAGDGTKIPAAATMSDLPPGLTQEEETTFCIVQGAVMPMLDTIEVK